MFCPKCGTESQSENAYCKRCGEWLPDIAGSTRHRFLKASPEQMTNKILVLSGLSALFGLISCLALYVTFFSGDRKAAISLAATFCFVISVYQTITFLNGLKLRQRLKRGRGKDKNITGQNDAYELNEAEVNAFANERSVTEKTTELLERLPRAQGERRK